MKALYNIFFSGMLLFSFSCANNKEPGPAETCVGDTVKYAQLGKLLQTHGCLDCHNNSVKNGGISLADYNSLKLHANHAIEEMEEKKMPQPGNGYDVVPQAKIDSVKRWVCQKFPK